jgi:hypothetical protein
MASLLNRRVAVPCRQPGAFAKPAGLAPRLAQPAVAVRYAPTSCCSASLVLLCIDRDRFSTATTTAHSMQKLAGTAVVVPLVPVSSWAMLEAQHNSDQAFACTCKNTPKASPPHPQDTLYAHLMLFFCLPTCRSPAGCKLSSAYSMPQAASAAAAGGRCISQPAQQQVQYQPSRSSQQHQQHPPCKA